MSHETTEVNNGAAGGRPDAGPTGRVARTYDEIVRAHDIIAATTLDGVDFGIKKKDKKALKATLNVLCWLLGHESKFPEMVGVVEELARRKGFVLTRPDRVPGDIPPEVVAQLDGMAKEIADRVNARRQERESRRCPECHALHTKAEPHDAYSDRYQESFVKANGRMPTWDDALAHLSPAARGYFVERLNGLGAYPEIRRKDAEAMVERLVALDRDGTIPGVSCEDNRVGPVPAGV